MGYNTENNEIEKLEFNIEYCQISLEDGFIKWKYYFKYWLKNLRLPIIFLFIILFLIIVLLISYLSQPTESSKGLSGDLQIALAILTASLTFLLVVLRENYNSAADKLVYFDGFMMEVKNNIEYLNANYETAHFENKHICKGTINHTDDFRIEPIFPLQFEFWELLKSKINLKDLNMNIKELERFVYDVRRCNNVIDHRNNVKLLYETTALINRSKYNARIIRLTKYAREHLFNAMEKRGILVYFDETKMKELKKKETSDFIKFLQNQPEFEKITFTKKNKEDLITSFNREPGELYIYYYNKYGPVK